MLVAKQNPSVAVVYVFREYRGKCEGKPKPLVATVSLNDDCKGSSSDRRKVVGLEKTLYTGKGRNCITVIKILAARRAKGWKKWLSKKGEDTKVALVLVRNYKIPQDGWHGHSKQDVPGDGGGNQAPAWVFRVVPEEM